MNEDEEASMAQQLVSAVEKGFPNDKAMQIRQLALRAQQAPIAFTGVFLRALQAVCEDIRL